MSELCFTPAAVLANDLRSKRISSREVMEAHLDRIEMVNPQVNAIVQLRDRDEIMADAAEADEALAKGEPRGPLHGLPHAVKDLSHVLGFATRYGSPVPPDVPAGHDSLFVSRVRAAGAIMIGKTNTPEFGAGSHTFNPIYGTTLNPFNRERTAGGSSGGAACSLATGMLPLADGSDLGGSLRNPAAWNGVFGLRPSVGRVPKGPEASAFFNTLGVPGPMARSVDDLALLLSVMAGPHPIDPMSLSEPGSVFGARLRGELDGVRVGWADDYGLPFEDEALEVPRQALERFDAAGCIITHDPPDLSGAMQTFKALRALIYREVGGLDCLPQDRWPELKDSLRQNIELGMSLTVQELMDAEQIRTRIHMAMVEWFKTHDVLAVPTTQVTAFPVEVEYPTEINGTAMESYVDWMASCCIVTVTGCPAISVPVGFDSNGCPLGLQLIGPVGSELKLLDIAKGFEAATGDLRRRPTILAA